MCPKRTFYGVLFIAFLTFIMFVVSMKTSLASVSFFRRRHRRVCRFIKTYPRAAESVTAEQSSLRDGVCVCVREWECGESGWRKAQRERERERDPWRLVGVLSQPECVVFDWSEWNCQSKMWFPMEALAPVQMRNFSARLDKLQDAFTSCVHFLPTYFSCSNYFKITVQNTQLLLSF